MIAEVYEWVKDARGRLIEYCSEMPAEVFGSRRGDFGYGSLLATLLHVADCYRFWLAETVMKRDLAEFQAQDYPDAGSLKVLFQDYVDPLVEEFLAGYGSPEALGRPLNLHVHWQESPYPATPLWLMTHVITHEFHHKGQIVALGRVLGYPPPETDLYLPQA